MDSNERLEIEDEDTRQRRIETLLQRTNDAPPVKNAQASTSSSVVVVNLPTVGDYAKDDDAHTGAAPSELLLERVRNFLPQMADSNAALAKQRPDEVDIENVGEDDDHYIEMNLGLGVFEYRQQHDSGEEEQHLSSTSTSTTTTSSSSDSDSDTDSSSSSSSDDSTSSTDPHSTSTEQPHHQRTSALNNRPIKPLPKRRRPEIIVIGGEPPPPSDTSSDQMS